MVTSARITQHRLHEIKSLIEREPKTGLSFNKVDPRLTGRIGHFTPLDKVDGVGNRALLSVVAVYPAWLLTGWGTRKEVQGWHRFVKNKMIHDQVLAKDAHDDRPYGITLESHLSKREAKEQVYYLYVRAKQQIAAESTKQDEFQTLKPFFEIPFYFGRTVMSVKTSSLKEAQDVLQKATAFNPPLAKLKPRSHSSLGLGGGDFFNGFFLGDLLGSLGNLNFC